MNPLESAILKAEWAHEHLNILQREVSQLLGSDAQTITVEIDSQHSRYIFRTAFNQSVVHKWGLRVGDIADNLRATLDHIAYRLVVSNTNSQRVKDAATFPLMNKRNDRGFAGRTRHFNPLAIDKIERFQPYVTHPIEPRSSPLRMIARLAIISKHITIPIIPIGVGMGHSGLLGSPSGEVIFYETGVVNFPIPSSESQEELKPQITAEPQIKIAEPDLIFHYSFGYLHDAYNIIRHEIIPTFVGILPETIDPL